MISSKNFAPSADLLPYVRRFYLFDAALPDDFVLEDQLLAENAFVRVLLHGDWTVEPAQSEEATAGKALLFGSNSKPLKVKIKGPFRLAAFAVRPSAWRALFKQPARDYVNKMVALTEAWGDLASDMAAKIKSSASDEEIVAAFESAVRAQLEQVGRKKVDTKIGQFEAIARTDSAIRMEDAASQVGLSVRQLERRCLTAYGISPKTVLRRSRFLDMAEGMRGFSSPEDEKIFAARYFDPSHLNREFRMFCNMTPGKFAKATTPLFTVGLKLRIEGKDIV
jgi:AraC-like DNA-binding protein